MKRKLLSALLAVTLLLGILSGVGMAAGAPVLAYTPAGSGKVTLALENLDGTDVYAVQLELQFQGEYPDAAFAASDASAFQPEQRPSVENGVTTLMVYLVNGDKPLGRGRSITLGTLTVGKNFTMPGSVKVSALDENSRPLADADGATVKTQQKQSSGGSGTVSGSVPTPTPTPTPSPKPGAMPFADVNSGHWFYSAVKFVYEKGMMSGMTGTTFAPDTTTNRGMIVTILYRMEGSPAAGAPKFSDVVADKYYAKAIAWATEKGIASGYPDGTFAPESNITREQLAVILYRYAAYKGYGTAASKDLSGFADRADVSGYAADALRWAVGAKLISGVTDTTLVPKGSATRAQAASILMRFCQTIGK